jgi:hypothetical protein
MPSDSRSHFSLLPSQFVFMFMSRPAKAGHYDRLVRLRRSALVGLRLKLNV